MGRIGFDSFFDKDGIKKGITEIATALEELSQKFSVFQKEAKSDDSFVKLAKTTEKTTFATNQYKLVLTQLATVEKQIQSLLAKQTVLRSKEAKELVKTKVETKRLADALLEEVTGRKRAVAELKRDKAQRKQLNGILKEHIKNLTATNPRLKAMGNHYRKLERDTKRAAIAQERMNKAAVKTKKATRGLLTSFKNITAQLRNLAVAYFGFTTLLRGVSDIFKVTKALDSIEFSQRKVIKSSFEFAQTQQWLSQIINDYGLDLITVTNRYTKFRAATVSSNLSAKQTQAIFGSMSKAAATLGLKTDELQGVYLALEQMISKNLVTTEELRRQLGERLPGAFDIMAKSLGKTTRELNKMLRAGLVVSEDVLPGFAIAVEKAYGIQSVKLVDTLVAAQNRLRTAWIEFIKILDGSDAFKNFLNAIASGIKFIGDNIAVIGRLTKTISIILGVYAAWKVLVIAMIVLRKLNIKWIAAERLATILYTNANKKLAASFILLSKAIKTNPIGFALVALLAVASAVEVLRASFSSAKKEVIDFNKEAGIQDARLKILFDSLRNAKKGTKEWTTAMQEINREHGRSIDKLIDEKTSTEELNKAQKDITETVRSLIAERRLLAAIDNAAIKISEAQTVVTDKLTREMEGLSITVKSRTLNAFLDLADKLSELSIMERRAAIDGGVLNDILEDTGIDADNAGDLMNGLIVQLRLYNNELDLIKARFEPIIEEKDKDIIAKLSKEIEKARIEFRLFYRMTDGEARDFFAAQSKFISDETKTFEKWLDKKTDLFSNNNSIVLFLEKQRGKESTTEFEKELAIQAAVFDEFNKQKDKRVKLFLRNQHDFLTEDVDTIKKHYKVLLKDLTLSVQERIVVASKLFDLETGGKGKGINIKLQTQREVNKQLLAEEKTFLEQQKSESIKALLEQGKSKSQITQFIQDVDSENKIALLNSARTLNDNLKELAVGNTKEVAKVKADGAKLEADITKEKTDAQIVQIKRGIDEAERLRDQQVITDIDRVQKQFKFAADELIKQLKNREITAGEFQLKYAEIERDTQRQILQIQLDAEKKKLALLEIGTIEYENARNRIVAFEKNLNDGITKENKTWADSWIENRQSIRDKSIELINEVFNAQMQAFENQRAAAEELMNFEVALAGSNIEERIKAERKFEKEELKIRQRQARAQKAQAAFNIITSTAAAIAKTLEITGFFGIPLTILVAAIGAVQLATVLAQPIPKFFEGVESKSGSGLAIVGEDKGSKMGGSELITLPSGDSFLSPDSATVMNLPSGTNIKSHSETQRILANGAAKTAYGGISMSKSEGYLKDIRDKETITYIDNYKIINREGYEGRFRCS